MLCKLFNDLVCIFSNFHITITFSFSNKCVDSLLLKSRPGETSCLFSNAEVGGQASHTSTALPGCLSFDIRQVGLLLAIASCLVADTSYEHLYYLRKAVERMVRSCFCELVAQKMGFPSLLPLILLPHPHFPLPTYSAIHHILCSHHVPLLGSPSLRFRCKCKLLWVQ